jgi:UTP--glucose-1-phosphate uridylyltransferase
LPATKTVPKELLPVAGKPLIQWAVEEAVAAGCEEFIFVTSPAKHQIIEHFQSAPHYEAILQARGDDEKQALLAAGLPPQAIVHEVSQIDPMGLGHAIWCAHELIGDEAFAVILPDDLILGATGCLTEMVRAYSAGHMLALEMIPPDQTHRYGIADIDPSTGIIRGLVEKPAPEQAPSQLAVVGRYILDGAIMQMLAKQQTGVGGEIQLTDGIANMIGQIDVQGFEFSGQRYDCGSPAGYLEANIAYSLSPYGTNLGNGLQERLMQVIRQGRPS